MKIVVLSADAPHRDQLREILGGKDMPTHTLFVIDGGLERLAAVVDQQQPELVVLDIPSQDGSELALLERVAALHPQLALILICGQMPAEFLISAMRVGVRDVLNWPLAKDALIAAIRRVEQQVMHRGTTRAKAKVLAFTPCKGGSGATFLAANLAYALATEENRKVALFDLNLQYGDAVLFLADRTPSTTLADVTSNIARLDASLLAASMVHITPNLSVLPAPETPERALEVTPEQVDVVLAVAATQFDFVVLDVGRELVGTSVKALDHADVIFPVLQETLPFVRDAKRLLSTLRSLNYPATKIHLIINRYEPGGDIRPEDVERALDMQIYATIPNSYESVSASVNQGVPILKLTSHDAVSKSLKQIAHELAHGPAEKRGGWLSHLLHHA